MAKVFTREDAARGEAGVTYPYRYAWGPRWGNASKGRDTSLAGFDRKGQRCRVVARGV